MDQQTLTSLWTGLLNALNPFVNINGRLYWPLLVAYAVMALIAFGATRYLFNGRRKNLGYYFWVNPTKKWQFVTAFFHRSTYVDVGTTIYNSSVIFLAAFIGIPVSMSAALKFWGYSREEVLKGIKVDEVWAQLTSTASIELSDVGIAVGWTLVTIISYDFIRTLIHFAFHKVPFLWEFHKLHHDSDRLTPLSTNRMAVFEEAISYFLVGTCTAFSFVGFVKMFGFEKVNMLTVGSVNVILFLTFLWVNFRHSSVWLHFGRFGYILASPAGHIIHHSCELEHRDKNYANIFPLWDLMLGSLYIPTKLEHFSIGVKKSNGDRYIHRSLRYAFFGVYADAWRVFRGQKPSYELDLTVKDSPFQCWCGPDCKEIHVKNGRPNLSQRPMLTLKDFWNPLEEDSSPISLEDSTVPNRSPFKPSPAASKTDKIAA